MNPLYTAMDRPLPTVHGPVGAGGGSRVAAGPLFEFACHEGNYGIVNVLRGARVRDTHAAGR